MPHNTISTGSPAHNMPRTWLMTSVSPPPPSTH